MNKLYGWYDGVIEQSFGNVTLFYFNGLITNNLPDFTIGDLYDKDRYIQAIKNFASVTDKSIIVQLPYWNVNGTFNLSDKLTSWWSDVVEQTQHLPQIHGYYLFDEPEYWGTSLAPNIPELTHTEAMDLYNIVKSKTNKPTFVAFASLSNFEAKYKNLTPFYDVFMFDVYPFLSDETLAQNSWIGPRGSEGELNYILERITRWKPVVELLNMPTVYIGQAYFSPEFPTRRRLSREDMALTTSIIKEHFPNLDGYMLWSWLYNDDSPEMRVWGNEELLSWFVWSNNMLELGKPVIRAIRNNDEAVLNLTNPAPFMEIERRVDERRWVSIADNIAIQELREKISHRPQVYRARNKSTTGVGSWSFFKVVSNSLKTITSLFRP